MTFRNRATQPSVLGRQKHGISLPMLLAAGAVLASFLWQGHMGISTGDEGFLWYGAQRVLQGDVPVRDFMSYDPGRYYWAAMIMALLGNDGIIALRIANTIIQAMGLFLGLLLIDRSAQKRSVFFLLAATITMIFWMFPWFKLFDISLSIALIGILSFMVEQPSNRRYFLAGLFVGIIAALCRQQGAFGAAGSLGVMVYLALKRQHGPGFIKGFFIWSWGVVAGYFPVFLMLALVPGYALAFWNSIRVYLFEMKGGFSSLQVPWPWRVPFGHLSLGAEVRGMLTGIFFMALVVYGATSLVWVIYQRVQQKAVSSALVATAFLAFPYAFYVFVCPDVSRLGLGLFPFLIGVLVLLQNMSAKFKWPLGALLCGASLLVMLPNHPGWARKQYVRADVAGSKLMIYPEDANYFTLLSKLAHDYAPGGQSFIAAPRFPSAYAFLKRKSPMYSIYSEFPRSEAFQQAEIERIKLANPGFAIISDGPSTFGLRFQDTHPMIFKYILDHFEPLFGYTENSAYKLYKSKRIAS